MVDERDIENLLGTTIYKRAFLYYKEGRVIASYSKSDGCDTIDAIVRGSGENRYRVHIVFDTHGNFKDATCTCPYPYYCKHIGAVLLKFLDDAKIYPSIAKGDFELPGRKDVAKRREDEIIPLKTVSREKSDVFFRKLSEDIVLISEKLSDRRKGERRFKLVFVLEERWLSLTESNGCSGWVVKPYLRYIRRDGTLGRFVLFSYEKLDFSLSNRDLSNREKELLFLLTDGDGDKCIDYFIGLLLEYAKEKPDSLFIKTVNGFKTLKIQKITKTVIRFSFHSLEFKGEEKKPIFEPIFEFYNETQNPVRIKTPVRFSSVSIPFFIVDSTTGTILYLENNEDIFFRKFISSLLGVREKYDYSMIEGFKTFVSRHSKIFEHPIEVRFSVKQIRLAYITPQPVLELRTLLNEVEIHILFKYRHRIVEYGSDAELLFIGEEKKDIVVAVRDIDSERRWITFLKNYLGSSVVRSRLGVKKREIFWQANLDRGEDTLFIVEGDINDFLVSNGEKLLEEGFELRRKGKKINSITGVSLVAKGNLDWLDVAVEIDVDGEKGFRLNPIEDKIEEVLLRRDDSYYLLKREDITKLKSLFLQARASTEGFSLSDLNVGLIDELYDDFVNKENERLVRLKNLIDALRNFKGMKRIKTPDSFHGVLREYQQDGLDWLYFLYDYNLNGILADDMGLGKTVQVLSLFSVLKERNLLERVLIVAPVSTLANWIEEIRKFIPHFDIYLHYGQGRIDTSDSISKTEITIVSYQTLRNDIDIFKGITFTCLVLDEAQIAKNPVSKVYRALSLIKAEHKLALTGTPVENSTVDLWALMNLLNPGLLGSLSEFKNRFAGPIERENDEERRDLLRKVVSPFILRREKGRVLTELPPKREFVLYATMEEKQRRIYESVKAYFRERIANKIDQDGLGRSSTVIFEALLRLRQLAILPSLVSDEYSDVPSCKFDLLKMKVGEILSEGHKVLIFSQFRGSLTAIREWLDSMEVDYSYLDGSTRSRELEIKSFQEDNSKRVFVISLKAGGLGINLTAADYVIVFDPWWNPAVEMQAIDRSHRIGQVNRVMIYKFITKDTVEEKILRLQNEKARLVTDIISSEQAFLKNLNRDEILSFFV